jgi:3-oxoacyl-[acyl-carrier protein] reductase
MADSKENDHRLLLTNKVAIITGAAKGIGKAIAIEMTKVGAKVIIADIDEEGLYKTQKLVQEHSGNAVVIPTDVSNEDQNNRLVDATLRQFSRIDILVNNAGINTPGGILEASREGSLDVLNTNLVGPFFLTQRVAKAMVGQKVQGSILFTSSVHGQITQLRPAYTTSKAALEMFVRDIALELAEYGIRVNAVAPGSIAIRGEKDRTNPYIPLGYRGIPTDIANTMIFLASSMGSYITGQTLVVDGGLSIAHAFYWAKKGTLWTKDGNLFN